MTAFPSYWFVKVHFSILHNPSDVILHKKNLRLPRHPHSPNCRRVWGSHLRKACLMPRAKSSEDARFGYQTGNSPLGLCLIQTNQGRVTLSRIGIILALHQGLLDPIKVNRIQASKDWLQDLKLCSHPSVYWIWGPNIQVGSMLSMKLGSCISKRIYRSAGQIDRKDRIGLKYKMIDCMSLHSSHRIHTQSQILQHGELRQARWDWSGQAILMESQCHKVTGQSLGDADSAPGLGCYRPSERVRTSQLCMRVYLA